MSSLNWLSALGSTILLAGSVLAAPGEVGVVTAPAATPANAQELQPLLARLAALSDQIGRASQSQEVWRSQLEQADVLLQLAMLSQGKERDNFLKLAVDSYFSAAVQSPANEQGTLARLAQLPGHLAQLVPGHPLIAYSARQEIQAEYNRMLEKVGDKTEIAQTHFCQRLVLFSQEYQQAPEAPGALMQAGQLNETLGKTEEARRCYRSLTERWPTHILARKAQGALWRLGRDSEPVQLALPLLFSSCDSEAPHFNLDQLRGQIVVVYFWASTNPQATEDFALLRQLTDRYHDRLDVVYVNLDSEPILGRAFLSGKLTAGVHCFLRGGLEGPVMERYGIQSLPQAFLVGRDGILLRHSLQVAQLETVLTGQVTRNR